MNLAQVAIMISFGLLVAELRGFQPANILKWSRLRVREHHLQALHAGDGDNGDDGEHAHYGSEEEGMTVPMVGSRKNLFGTLQLPRDSVNQALRSSIPEDELHSLQDMAGLERDSPTEVRTRTETDEDGYAEDIVETVDTFRFTMSKADLERAMAASGESSDVVEELEVEELDAETRLLADKDFLQHLEGAEYEIREDGKKVLRIEMDLDELQGMLGADMSSDEDKYDEHRRSRKADRYTSYDANLMSQVEDRVSRRGLRSVDKGGVIGEQNGGEGEEEAERNLPMFDWGPGKPRWTMSGVDRITVVGDLVGSVVVIAGYSGVLRGASATGSRVVRFMHSFPAKKMMSRLHGVTIPWLTLGVLFSYVGYHFARHHREGQRFRGIGFAPPRESLTQRLFPNFLDVKSSW